MLNIESYLESGSERAKKSSGATLDKTSAEKKGADRIRTGDLLLAKGQPCHGEARKLGRFAYLTPIHPD